MEIGSELSVNKKLAERSAVLFKTPTFSKAFSFPDQDIEMGMDATNTQICIKEE